MPKVSVLMPVYNGEKYLAQAIESILTQTFTNFELILVDDFSTDGSRDVIAKYAAQDNRIVVANNSENMGLTKSLNKALKLAKGDYIARQDDDDASLPERFAQQVKFMDTHPTVGLCGTFVDVIDANGEFVRTSRNPVTDIQIREALVVNNCITHGSMMARKSVLTKINGYDENIRRAQDYDLFLRLSEVTKLANIPTVLYQWRKHETNMDPAYIAEQLKYVHYAQHKKLERLPNYPAVKSNIEIGLYVLFLEKTAQTIECLQSFLPSGIKIYILNNGSSTESLKALHEFCDKYPQIKILDSDKNLGVGVGRNFLIEHSKEEWMLFVDNDITVKTADWLEKAKQHILLDPYTEVFIPQLYNVHNDTYDIYYPFRIVGNQVESTGINYGRTNKFPGGASIVNRNVFNRLGLYDEKMFVGYEDFELAIRAIRLTAPVKGRIVDDIELVHKHIFSAKTVDQKYAQTRYSTNHLENSYNRVVEKHGVYLPADYAPWAKEKIEQMTATSFRRRVRLGLSKIKHLALRIGRKFLRKPGRVVYKLWRRYYVYNTIRTILSTVKVPVGKKHVVFLHPFFTVGGAETVSINIGKQLDRSEFYVTIVGCYPSPNEWLAKFQSAFDRVIDLGSTREDAKFALVLRLVAGLHPDIVFVSNTTVGYDVLPQLKAWQPKLKIVDLVHARGWFENYSQPFVKLLDKRVFISQHFYNFMSENKYAELADYKNRIEIIPNGIDTEAFHPAYQKQHKQFVVSYVGRLGEEKDPLLVADIAAEVVHENENVQFVVAGDGELMDDMRSKVAELGLDQKIKLPGYVAHEQVAHLLNESDVLILTSTSEGLPISILEAMAVGKPVITTDVGAIHEILQDGVQGYLIKRDIDVVEHFADKILLLAKDKALYEKLSVAARDRVEQNFDQKLMGERYNKLFKGLVR